MNQFIIRITGLSVLALLTIIGMYYYDLRGYEGMRYTFNRTYLNNTTVKYDQTIVLPKGQKFAKILGFRGDTCFILDATRKSIFALNLNNGSLKHCLAAPSSITASVLWQDTCLIFRYKTFEVYDRSFKLITAKAIEVTPNKAIATSTGEIFVRIPEDSTLSRYQFGIFSTQGKIIKVHPNQADTLIEGGLATDGFMVNGGIYSFYIYHYGDKVFCFTPDLNEAYIAKTIDKLDIGLPDVFVEKKTKSAAFRSPRRINHLMGFTKDSSLFINSALKSTTDMSSLYRTSMVLDRYNTRTGAYNSSVRLSEIDINDASDIETCGEKVYLLLSDKLKIYDYKKIAN